MYHKCVMFLVMLLMENGLLPSKSQRFISLLEAIFTLSEIDIKNIIYNIWDHVWDNGFQNPNKTYIICGISINDMLNIFITKNMPENTDNTINLVLELLRIMQLVHSDYDTSDDDMYTIITGIYRKSFNTGIVKFDIDDFKNTTSLLCIQKLNLNIT
jgi:hypothetical protein